MRAAWIALLVAAGCARSDAEWRHDLTNPSSDPFERGLAAFALAEQAPDDLAGVPTVLLELLDGPPGRMQARAAEVLRSLGPAACPEMAFCLVNNTFFAEDSRAALEAALVRNGAAAVPPLVAALPAAAGARAERIAAVIASIGEPAVDPLVAILREQPPSPHAVAAVRLLARLGHDTERALRDAAASPDPALAAAAVDAIVRRALNRSRLADAAERERLLRETIALGDAAIPELLQGLSRGRAKESAFASEVLLAAGARWSLAGPRAPPDKTRIEDLGRRLAGPGGPPRAQAALELARAGRHAAPAAGALLRALDDPDRSVRFCASLALTLIAVDAAGSGRER